MISVDVRILLAPLVEDVVALGQSRMQVGGRIGRRIDGLVGGTWVAIDETLFL